MGGKISKLEVEEYRDFKDQQSGIVKEYTSRSDKL